MILTNDELRNAMIEPLASNELNFKNLYEYCARLWADALKVAPKLNRRAGSYWKHLIRVSSELVEDKCITLDQQCTLCDLMYGDITPAVLNRIFKGKFTK